ncbi:MAG: hypothetical protein QNJ72_18765 [Pleurocapsa sp. MO_226.B13]|nr:hypothetical protein [Pleurocapsa sp. MO_226.B13]
MEVIREYIQGLDRHGIYPDRYICYQKQGNLVEIEAEVTGIRQQVLSFCTNDILGRSQSKTVKQAAIDAIVRYGTSNSSCPMLSGRIGIVVNALHTPEEMDCFVWAMSATRSALSKLQQAK